MKKNPHVKTVLKMILEHIRKGSESIDPTRSFEDGIDDLFGRRYQLTFRERLKEKGSWERDKNQVLKAAEMHGIIAAAASHFSPPGLITQTVFMKAAHMVELECYDYVKAGQKRRLTRNQMPLGGQWCW